MENPYYNEQQPWMTVDPDQANRDATTQWLRQQEDQRLFQLQREANNGFAGLQNVADQTAPHPVQHHPGLGTLAAGAAIGYFATRALQAPQQDYSQQDAQPVHREPRRANVWGWYFLLGALVTIGVGMLSVPVGVWFLVSTMLWIPITIGAVCHQRSINRYNDWLQQAIYRGE